MPTAPVLEKVILACETFLGKATIGMRTVTHFGSIVYGSDMPSQSKGPRETFRAPIIRAMMAPLVDHYAVGPQRR